MFAEEGVVVVPAAGVALGQGFCRAVGKDCGNKAKALPLAEWHMSSVRKSLG